MSSVRMQNTNAAEIPTSSATAIHKILHMNSRTAWHTIVGVCCIFTLNINGIHPSSDSFITRGMDPYVFLQWVRICLQFFSHHCSHIHTLDLY